MIHKEKWVGDSHEQWLYQRKAVEGLGSLEITRIGASDIGTVTGSNKWKCKRRLFYHLIGMYSSEWRTAKSVGGHLLENVVASNWESWVPEEEQFLYNLERGKKIRYTKKADFFLMNDDYPQLFVSVDRLHDGQTFSPFTGQEYAELTPIELKTTERDYYKLWEDGITQPYKEQVMSQMMVTGTEVAVFNVLVNGVYFHTREVEFDKVLSQFIDHETRQFAQLCIAGKQIVDLINSAKSKAEKEEYQAMLEDITPDASALDDEQDLNKELFSESNGSIKGSESDFKFLLDYQDAHDKIKALEELKQLNKNKITTLMKDAEEMLFEGGKVVWRRADGKRDYFSLKIDKI
jgi:predicted phage-related endonuclease